MTSVMPFMGPYCKWDVILYDPYTGDEIFLDVWMAIDLTENFDGIEATIDLPGSRPELAAVTELYTDILLYAHHELVFRLKIFSIEDTMDGLAHTAKITARSYEAILTRRVLFTDFQQTWDQHDIAWWLVNYTQQFHNLGITRVSGASGQTRTRVIQKAQTITDAINEVAQTDNGFDWWIDENLGFHMQTPRRRVVTSLDWKYGSQIAAVMRTGFAESYASVIMAIGATNETTLPGGTVYPPPPPAIRELAVKPVGRWEKVVSYSDIVTAQSVIDKAMFHLAESSTERPTYKLTVSPNLVYHKDLLHPGYVFTLRVQSLPRFDFEVQVRIEELHLSIDANGASVVEIGVRAESPEQDMAVATTFASSSEPKAELVSRSDRATIAYFPFADTFPGPSYHSHWAAHGLSPYAVITADGRSQQQLTNGSEGYIRSVASGAFIERTVLIEAQIPAAGIALTGPVRVAWFRVYKSDATTNSAQIQVFGPDLRFYLGATGLNNYTSVPYDQAAHRWWRITETNGGLQYDTSPDGINWTNRRSIPAHGLNFSTNMTLDVLTSFANQNAPGGPWYAYFDNLNSPFPNPVPPGTVSVTPAAPTGKTPVVAKTSYVGQFVALLHDMNSRILREERST